jgi:hypothetical protein
MNYFFFLIFVFCFVCFNSMNEYPIPWNPVYHFISFCYCFESTIYLFHLEDIHRCSGSWSWSCLYYTMDSYKLEVRAECRKSESNMGDATMRQSLPNTLTIREVCCSLVFVLLNSEFIELTTINRFKTVSIRVHQIEPNPSMKRWSYFIC